MSTNPTAASDYDRDAPPPRLTDAELARISVANATPYELVRLALDKGLREAVVDARWDEELNEWRRGDGTVTRAEVTAAFLDDVLKAVKPIDEAAWLSLYNHLDFRRWRDDDENDNDPTLVGWGD